MKEISIKVQSQLGYKRNLQVILVKLLLTRTVNSITVQPVQVTEATAADQWIKFCYEMS